MPTTKKNNLLEYKGHPLMRKENIIYYGSMSDSHIIMMQILESSDYKGLPVAKRVSVQLQQTDPNVRMSSKLLPIDMISPTDFMLEPIWRLTYPYSFSRPIPTYV